MTIDNGGPVFPTSEEHDVMDGNAPNGTRTDRYFEGGMSLRDYYAGQAMQGYLQMPNPEARENPDKCAAWAYDQADSMIARKRETEKADV